jgi:exopolyphosphatase / guanosine-5'-triphosphate,3'-diphosphate pyrophosphatase
MRMAVLDVGSQAVNLVLADTGGRTDGKLPFTTKAWKTRTGVAACLRPDGLIGAPGRDRCASAVAEAADRVRRAGVERVFAYGTAAIRDAPNREQVLDEIESRAGIRLGLLAGVEEAELTFLAARCWLSRPTRTMLLLDIGGGTIEVASGHGQVPESALSLPLGAGRMTREFFGAADPPPRRAVRHLHRHVRAEIHAAAKLQAWAAPRTVVAASRTFYQLSRLTGAPPMRHGPHRSRTVQRAALRKWIERLARIPAAKRERLPGVSAHRATQILAGAVVAYELMGEFEAGKAQITPWGLREGVLLRLLQDEHAFAGITAAAAASPPR